MRRVLFTILFSYTILLRNGVSMEFHIDYSGHPAIYGTGPIIAGDAERFRPWLDKVPRDKFGYKHLWLHSGGGSVDAAMEMAHVMDEDAVSTLIPPGASCASACASILFVAGGIHLIAPNGRIGLHTCFDGISRTPDDVCNVRIAEFARDHGTMWGSVYIIQNATAPDDLVWFDMSTANCFGLLKWPDNTIPDDWNACVKNAVRNLKR